MQDFRKLRSWRAAVDLAGLVYGTTATFPNEERYSLTSQMRRSAGSVASNIAEGCGRESRDDYVRFLRMAYASACELETHAHIARVAAIGEPSSIELIIERSEDVRRMLTGLKRSVAKRDR